MNNRILDIPEIAVSESNIDKERNTVFINLNYYMWLNELIEEFRISHLRWYPHINILMPDGRLVGFATPVVDPKTADLVYTTKSGLKLRLGWR